MAGYFWHTATREQGGFLKFFYFHFLGWSRLALLYVIVESAFLSRFYSALGEPVKIFEYQIVICLMYENLPPSVLKMKFRTFCK